MLGFRRMSSPFLRVRKLFTGWGSNCAMSRLTTGKGCAYYQADHRLSYNLRFFRNHNLWVAVRGDLLAVLNFDYLSLTE